MCLACRLSGLEGALVSTVSLWGFCVFPAPLTRPRVRAVHLLVLVFLRVTVACSSARNQLFDVFTDAVAFWKESGGNAAQQD